MNSRDRNGLYGGGNMRPCGSGRKCDSRSSRISTTRVVASSGSDLKAISRPKNPRSARAGIRFAKIVSMLVICATAITAVSAITHASVDSEKVIAQDLLPPYTLEGLTTNEAGTVYYACSITVTNIRTGESNTTTSFESDGYYTMDLQHQWPGAFIFGDLVNVTAINDTNMLIGWNEQPIPGGPGMWIDVYMNGTWDGIPEFPMVIVPVTGMLALFAVVSLKRRAEDQ